MTGVERTTGSTPRPWLGHADFVRRGSVLARETTTFPVTSRVIDLLPDMPAKYQRLQELAESHPFTASSLGRFVDDLATMTVYFTEQKKAMGHGYISCSIKFDSEREIFWSALAAHLIGEAGFHPLVIPIDQFYSYGGAAFVITHKVTDFSRRGWLDSSGRPYWIILTAFAESQIFTREVLPLVPNQATLGTIKHLFNNEKGVISDEDTYYLTTDEEEGLHAQLITVFEQEREITEVLNWLWKQAAEGTGIDQARLILATSMLMVHGDLWQGLWYESTQGKGVPLLIVAPSPWHDALNRLNYESWCPHSYRQRAALGRVIDNAIDLKFDENGFPTSILQVEDGFVPAGVALSLETGFPIPKGLPLFLRQGCTAAEFTRVLRLFNSLREP